jgi:hypothetical protein
MDDPLEFETWKKHRKTTAWFCILLVFFIVANAVLYASKLGRLETGTPEHEHAIQGTIVAVRKKPKIEKEGNNYDTAIETSELENEAKYDAAKDTWKFEVEDSNDTAIEEEPYERDFILPLITFDELIRRFNETAPNSTFKPNCLSKPKTTRPTIFFSLGRSGSSVILDWLLDVTNSQWKSITMEYVGQNLYDNEYFFNTTIPAEEKFKERNINHIPHILERAHAVKRSVPGLNNSLHGEWLVSHICRTQRDNPDDLVGFKWKPNFDQFGEQIEPRETLQVVALLAAEAPKDEPPVVFIRNRRNILDARLSALKHDTNPDLNSVCYKGDEACLRKHRLRLFVPDIPDFFTDVHSIWQHENMLDKLLVALKIPHVSVSYDTLFYPDNITDGEDEWNSMVKLISPGSPRFSWEEIQDAMPLAATSSTRSHMELIENWEEVYEVFEGTEVEHLFRF